MSFWDCGEYIATAAKLQVGHPPELFISNDWRVLCDVCHRQSTYCSNGKYDFSQAHLQSYFYSGLHR
jgi:hypothetical protein